MHLPPSFIILAPMEGVMDHAMRDLITRVNHIDLCITEFVRVVDKVLPRRCFTKLAPELLNQGFTPNGTPVRIQLLGQQPQCLADNAIKALQLGSHGIDLNFGCPAKTVNKHKGGAVLLDNPELIFQIVDCCRKAMPIEQPLSVKIRLGNQDSSRFYEVLDAIEQAKANMLTIHGRTKRQGYRPPAYWHYIGEAVNRCAIPIVANGEIWHKNDAERCQQESGTNKLMLGRGILSLPNLANVIKFNESPLSWLQVLDLLMQYSQKELASDKRFYFTSRVKQWLSHLKRQYPEANILFEQIKQLHQHAEVIAIIEQQLELYH